MILLFSIILSTLLLLLYFLRQKYAYWKNQEVPFPKTTLLFGNIGEVLFLRTTLSEFFDRLYRTYEDYSYVGFYNFLTPAVVIRDPQIISEVLIQNFESFHDVFIRTPDDIAKINPFFVEGDRWKEMRKEIAPHLSSLKIREMRPHIETGCRLMIKYIENLNGDNVDAEDITCRFTGNNVMACAYGLEGRCFEEEYPLILKIRDDMTIHNPTIAAINSTIGILLPNIANLLNMSYLGKHFSQQFRDMISEAIKTRENVYNSDYLNFLKEAKEKYQDLTHFGYAAMFYLDAFATSALAFAYALLELSLNPEVQLKAQKQIDHVSEKYKTIYSEEAQKEVDYIDNIILETIRMHTITKFLNRQCTKDIHLSPPKHPGARVLIKKGTQVFIPSYAIHHDSMYYEHPSRFNPDRFSLEQLNSRPKACYLGFGDGPRVCIGRKFGVTQIKMGLTAILSKFELHLDEKIILPVGEGTDHLSKTPKEKIWIKFCPRK
uniref:Cytochrome P450 n=3 Tax=Photinus pyralis TaxID=7054 RepID=A0A1Y1LIU5_PHOPY